MNRHLAYAVAQRELDALQAQSFEALAAMVGETRESRVSEGDSSFLVESTVTWAEPERSLCLAISVDSPGTHRFERLEERVFVTRPPAP